ncbi:reverse transcriptase domain-containing protein, partial [Tanacetum coccineum]
TQKGCVCCVRGSQPLILALQSFLGHLGRRNKPWEVWDCQLGNLTAGKVSGGGGRNVPNDVIKLMMFPYSLEGAAKTWYEKEPPNSILTWEDLVTKFMNQFFPPSKTTHLKNEISRFTQKFEETFSEAWERFKELLRACPHHGFTELTQVDTFYNDLNKNEQDSLNAAEGGNLLSKTTREALNIIKNKSKVRYSRNRSNVSRMNATSSKTDERIDKLAD